MKFTRIILLASVLLCSAYARLHAQYLGGSGDGYTSVTSEKIVLAIEDIPSLGSVPEAFKLDQNYPNPFNPTTRIRYALPEDSHVILRIYDVLGNLVVDVVNGIESAGYHEFTFDASKLSSGLYFYSIKANDYTETRKMLLIK